MEVSVGVQMTDLIKAHMSDFSVGTCSLKVTEIPKRKIVDIKAHMEFKWQIWLLARVPLRWQK